MAYSLIYTLNNDGSYSVTGYSGTITTSDNVVIPSTYNGLPVTSIGNSVFYNCLDLKNVAIGNSVTSIGERAFNGTGLTSITIPDSVTSIGDSAFSHCLGLNNVTIGNGVTLIDNNAFYFCKMLKSIVLLPSTPPILDNTGAINTNVTKIYVPKLSVDNYKSATNWASFSAKIDYDIIHSSFARYNQKNKAYIDQRIAKAIDSAYPVGSIYMSVNSTSPASLFGGSWTRIYGRFLLGLGSNTANTNTTYGSLSAGSINRTTVMEQGGEVKHQLTVSEMPSHNHEGWAKIGYGTGGGTSYGKLDTNNGSASTTWGVTVNNTGGGSSHNNMPPYYTVYMWRRTA